MRSLRLSLIAIATLTVLSAGTLAAQSQLPALKEDKPGLAAQARITVDSATRIAQARVPHGQVAAREIEMEHGKLIYSFDMKVPGKAGIDEVNVNAVTGALIGVEHEGAASEAREHRADSVAAARRRPTR